MLKKSSSSKVSSGAPASEKQVRLHVAMARAGVASRRAAEELIESGCVTVNGALVTQLGTKVDPNKDHVKVNGKLLSATAPAPIYIVMNKPKRSITSTNDPYGRMVVHGLLRGVTERVFTVGRLDWDTEGVLLITNDGALTNRLTHPRFEVPRVYRAKVRGIPEDKTLVRLSRGIMLEDGPSPRAEIRLRDTTGRNSWLDIELHEGRNRVVRRMCQAVGHPVMKLTRISYGGITAQGLRPGDWRYLAPEEVLQLKQGGKQRRPREASRDRGPRRPAGVRKLPR